MPQAASWAGTPHIKGSTESMRMALLTFSLIGLQDAEAKSDAVKMISKILKTTMHLPDRIQAICWVQFWAWIGWFPFLFYSTTWVGEVYFRYHPETNATASKDTLGDIGRVGSLSLVVFSIITFAGSVLLP
ncbi:hypothetical protein P7C71_g6489, partial [Lecanoromycetidae sp. Uapishka_2]